MQRRNPENPEKLTKAEILSKLSGWATVFVGTFVAHLVSSGVDYMKHLSESVTQMNQNVVAILERVGSHDKTLSRHEVEIEDLRHELPKKCR